MANKSGRSIIYANCFIDATGDADLAYLAGAPFQIGDEVQNVTLMFTVGGIDLERLVQEIEADGRIKGRGEWHTRVVRGPILDSDEPAIVHLVGHMDLWDDRPPLTFTAVSWKKNQASFNITRTVGIDPTNARDLVRAEISERRNVMETYRRFRERIPGMEGCELITTAPQLASGKAAGSKESTVSKARMSSIAGNSMMGSREVPIQSTSTTRKGARPNSPSSKMAAPTPSPTGAASPSSLTAQSSPADAFRHP